MDVVYDNYEPSALSFFDHVFGFFTGIRQKGFQTTEEILRDGSFITAIGELKAQNDSLTLQPSNAGPMFLTTATKGALLRRFEDAKTSMLTKAIFCGAIAALITAYIGRKIYLRKKQERAERRLKETLERERRERRQRSRVNPGRLSEDQKCVVCVTNPKEVCPADPKDFVDNTSWVCCFDFRSFVYLAVMCVCAKIVRAKSIRSVPCAVRKLRIKLLRSYHKANGRSDRVGRQSWIRWIEIFLIEKKNKNSWLFNGIHSFIRVFCPWASLHFHRGYFHEIFC